MVIAFGMQMKQRRHQAGFIFSMIWGSLINHAVIHNLIGILYTA